MYKKVALVLGLLYVSVSVYLLKLRINYSEVGSARGVGFSVICGTISYICGAYLITSAKKLNKLLGTTLLLTSLVLLSLQLWLRFYYTNAVL